MRRRDGAHGGCRGIQRRGKRMKTLKGFLTLSSLLLIASLGTGCALQGTTVTEEQESTESAATRAGDDDGADGTGSKRELAQPISPDRGGIGCTSCGPSPQPWQND